MASIIKNFFFFWSDVLWMQGWLQGVNTLLCVVHIAILQKDHSIWQPFPFSSNQISTQRFHLDPKGIHIPTESYFFFLFLNIVSFTNVFLLLFRTENGVKWNEFCCWLFSPLTFFFFCLSRPFICPLSSYPCSLKSRLDPFSYKELGEWNIHLQLQSSASQKKRCLF